MSLLGKITVIKSIALPKLIYPLTVLKNPSIEKLKQITKNMYAFIWDSKPEKIKRKHLVQTYQNGGLKMLDIDLFINSLKCSWLKRLFDNNNHGQWKNFYLQKINKYGGKLLFDCNLNENSILKMFPENNFLQEIVIAWANILNEKHNELNNIGKQIIWNNKHIQIQNNTIIYNAWLDKGIRNIEHIYDYRQKEFYSFQQIINLYNISPNDYLKYNQLVSSITREWKTRLKTENIINQPNHTLFEKLLKSDHVNRLLYKHQLKKETIPEFNQHDKWKVDINKTDINWKNIYSNTFISTTDLQLRNFQYKFLMRIIPTNVLFLKYKIKNSNLCDFCNMNIESNKHMFWGCIHTQHFWT